MKLRIAVLLAASAIAAQQASATSIIIMLGDNNSFTDQTQVLPAAFLAADGAGDPADVAPFNGVVCGTDSNTAGLNCSKTWTFTYSLPLGETITSATFGIGIGDLDTHAAGNQVGLLTVAGADLTADINSQAESLDLSFGPCPGDPGGNNNCWSSVYRQYTINIPSSAFVQLGTGSATVTFTTQGPGWGVLGQTSLTGSNSAYLDYSELTIDTIPTASLPEPGSLYSMAAGLAGLGLLRYRRRKA